MFTLLAVVAIPADTTTMPDFLLLALLAGELQPHDGRVQQAAPCRCEFVAQHLPPRLQGLGTRAVLQDALAGDPTADWQVDKMLTELQLEEQAELPVSALSGGQHTIKFEQANHLVFEGFDVTGGTSSCIFSEAHEVLVRPSGVMAICSVKTKPNPPAAREPISAVAAPSAKPSNTMPCTTANGGSEPVGANLFKKPIFWNDCTTRTNTLR